MEQFVRDVRIAQIYEGTNGVQAMDLVARKLPMENGDVARRFFALVREELAAAAGPAELGRGEGGRRRGPGPLGETD